MHSKCLLLVTVTIIQFSFSWLSDEGSNKRPLRGFINPYPRLTYYNDGGDAGEPLFLTPLINDPKIPKEKVQEMAHVKGKQWHGVTSYAGYLTVDPKYNSNMFFWYFPAVENTDKAPVILWLQGGPGASSLFGLFTENGPFQFDANGQLLKRNYTWSRTHNLIYIDNPVGTGYSFTENDAGYAKNEQDVGRNLHEAMMQLYELFSWTNSSGFWITGESYAGKYVPALAYHIHKVQNAIDTRVNIPLKGVAIGNGWSDPLHQLQYGAYLYQLGLIDDNALQHFNAAEKKAIDCIHKRDLSCAFDVMDELIDGDFTSSSFFSNLTGFNFYYNYLKTENDGAGQVLSDFIQSTSTRRAIHVGNKTFNANDGENSVLLHLKLDVMDSVSQWVAELLDHYTVCIYNGQLDIIVAYPMTRNYLNKLKWSGAKVYKQAKRDIWMVDNEVAGYVKHAGNLVEIMVRNAGHMVPTDQPKWAYQLIKTLTHNEHKQT